MLECQSSAHGFVGSEVRFDLPQKLKGLAVRHAERKAWGVSFARGAFIRDLSAARTIGDELQQTTLRACDAENKAPVLVAMLAAQRNRSFTIDQSGDVRGILRIELDN